MALPRTYKPFSKLEVVLNHLQQQLIQTSFLLASHSPCSGDRNPFWEPVKRNPQSVPWQLREILVVNQSLTLNSELVYFCLPPYHKICFYRFF